MSHNAHSSAASPKSDPAATSWRNDWSFWFLLSMIAAFLICAGSVRGENKADSLESVQAPTPGPLQFLPLPSPQAEMTLADSSAGQNENASQEAAKKAEKNQTAGKAEKETEIEQADDLPAPPPVEDSPADEDSSVPLPPMVNPPQLAVPPATRPVVTPQPDAAKPAIPMPMPTRKPASPRSTPEKASVVEQPTPASQKNSAKDGSQKSTLGSDLKPNGIQNRPAGKLMPLPETAEPENIGSEVDSPDSKEAPVVRQQNDQPRAAEPKGEPDVNVTEKTPAKTEETNDEETESWSILITPGKQHVTPQDKADRITTFKLDSETGQMIGGPEEKVLGPHETYHRPHTKQHVSPAGHHESARFPAQSPDVSNYQEIYDSIPYSRAEYLANPGYRHDATMEIMFGEMRPTTIHKTDTPRRIYNLPPLHEDPRVQRQPLPWSPYGPNNYLGYYYGPGMGYRFGYGPYWTPNSTYRRSATVYGPLFNRYYRPLGAY